MEWVVHWVVEMLKNEIHRRIVSQFDLRARRLHVSVDISPRILTI